MLNLSVDSDEPLATKSLGGLGGWIDRSVLNLLLAQTRHLPRSRWGDGGGLCPRIACDEEFSGAGVSGPVLACFVSDEGFVGLEWSAPNASHEKGSSINQVSVVLLHSSKLLRRIARRNSRVGGESVEGDRLASPRNWQLARAAPAQVPREHSSGACPQSAPTLATCSVNLLCVCVLGVYCCVSYHVQSP